MISLRYGVPDPMSGERIEAHVRLSEGARNEAVAELQKQLRAHCLAHLPLVRTPRAFHLWLEYPRKANGKVDRALLKSGDGGEPFAPSSG